MRFFGALDTDATLPVRSALDPRVDDRSARQCRTIGQFAVYMHDFGLDQFDARFRDDKACWNGSAAGCAAPAAPAESPDRAYTWWCNRRPNNPCVFGCPNQVDECSHPTAPKPRYVRYDGADPALSAPLTRWAAASSRGWPSPWALDRSNPQDNAIHVYNYTFGDGWATNLVTNVSASTGAGLDYWSHGHPRVAYDGAGAAAAASSYALPPGSNITGGNSTHVYWMGLDGAPNSLLARTISTSHRVYGGFTVAVTHESRSQTAADCYVNNAPWSGLASPSGGFSGANATCPGSLTNVSTCCPFTFRCFSTEANAGAQGPRCMPSFPGDYGAVAGAPAAPAWVGACGEFCPGCASCPMLRCWRTAPTDTPDSAYADLSALPYNTSRLQDDRVPYIRVRHYDEALVGRNAATGVEQTPLAWHANSWRLNACGSHTNSSGIRTTGLMERVVDSVPMMAAMQLENAPKNMSGQLTPRCAPYPRDSHTAGGYSDTYTLPALFPAPPMVKMGDTLVWLPELEELSFTDLAVVDHREWRTAAQLAGVTTSAAYAALRLAASEPAPQSLNDFAGACGRLDSSSTLSAYGMTRAQCDARAAAFGASVKVIRANASASQVPPMSGALHDEDIGDLAVASGVSDTAYKDRLNKWPSMVTGTLPPEWGTFFPNIEKMCVVFCPFCFPGVVYFRALLVRRRRPSFHLSPLGPRLPQPEKQQHNSDFGVAARALFNSASARRDSLSGTVPSAWGRMASLAYLNLHQQLGLCAWSDEDTPFDIHLMAMRDNTQWYLNLTANMDWTMTPQDQQYSMNLRPSFGQKLAVWSGGWSPEDAAGAASAAVGGRRAIQVLTPYNMTRRPFACLPNYADHNFTRLPEEMMMWPPYTEENCLTTSFSPSGVHKFSPMTVSYCKSPVDQEDKCADCCTPCGGLHYNGAVFVDHRDRRTWTAASGSSRVWNATSGSPYGLLQSLPKFDAPCARMWDRYFANGTTHVTWFTGQHQVRQAPFMADCLAKATAWQENVRSIRIVRNVTRPYVPFEHATLAESDVVINTLGLTGTRFASQGTGTSEVYGAAPSSLMATPTDTQWPALLYGTLPPEWGTLDSATNRTTFGNLKMM